MANISTNVSTGKPKISGGVWVAPSGTSLPTDATTELSGFTCLGYVSEDGVENSNDMDVAEIKAWGGSIVLRSLNGFADNFDRSAFRIASFVENAARRRAEARSFG